MYCGCGYIVTVCVSSHSLRTARYQEVWPPARVVPLPVRTPV